MNILDPPAQLVAERRYEITCESIGSRPNAIITWYKGKRQLRRTKVKLIRKSLTGFTFILFYSFLCLTFYVHSYAQKQMKLRYWNIRKLNDATAIIIFIYSNNTKKMYKKRWSLTVERMWNKGNEWIQRICE